MSLLVALLAGCGMVNFPAPTEGAYAVARPIEPAPEPVPRVDVAWRHGGVDVSLIDIDAPSFSFGLVDTKLDNWSGEDCLYGNESRAYCHAFEGTTGHLDSVWQEWLDTLDLDVLVEGETTLFTGYGAPGLTYVVATLDAGCWVFGHEPHYYLGHPAWSRCALATLAGEPDPNGEGAVEDQITMVWDADGVTVTVPADTTGFDLGIAETMDRAGGWLGEDCLIGTTSYTLCHVFSGTEGSLRSLYAEVLSGTATMDDIIAGETTLFDDTFADRLTFVATVDDGRCWVWGQDPSYYLDSPEFEDCFH